jgi:hypothetical protein
LTMGTVRKMGFTPVFSIVESIVPIPLAFYAEISNPPLAREALPLLTNAHPPPSQSPCLGRGVHRLVGGFGLVTARSDAYRYEAAGERGRGGCGYA